MNGSGWIRLGEFSTYQLNLTSNSVERAELENGSAGASPSRLFSDREWFVSQGAFDEAEDFV